MFKFNKKIIFNLFFTIFTAFLFDTSYQGVKTFPLGNIVVIPMNVKIINRGKLNDPLIVGKNIFAEIPRVLNGKLYMRFVSYDNKIGPWIEINNENNLKAPNKEGLYQIQFIIKSNNPNGILNFPTANFGIFDGFSFSNVFDGLIRDENFSLPGKVIPIIYEDNLIISTEKSRNEESQPMPFNEESHSENFNPELPPTEDSYDESIHSNDNINTVENKPNKFNNDFEEYTSNNESSYEENIQSNNNINTIGNEPSIFDNNYFEQYTPNKDLSPKYQSPAINFSPNGSPANNSPVSKSNNKSPYLSSSIKTGEDFSYYIAIMIGSFIISLFYFIERVKKLKICGLDQKLHFFCILYIVSPRVMKKFRSRIHN